MLSRKNYESAAEIFRVARTRQKLGGGAGGSEALDSLAAGARASCRDSDSVNETKG